MNLSKIAHIGDPILRKPTREVPVNRIKSNEIQKLIKRLINTMHEYNGAGLAANQIFENYRICVVEVKENMRYKYLPEIPLKILINPKIISYNKEYFSSFEGCLSVPNMRGKVRRSSEIEITYFDQNAKFKKEKSKGFEAIVFQHEIDHLDGILFTDRIISNKSLVTYENYVKYFETDYLKELINFEKKDDLFLNY